MDYVSQKHQLHLQRKGCSQGALNFTLENVSFRNVDEMPACVLATLFDTAVVRPAQNHLADTAHSQAVSRHKCQGIDCTRARHVLACLTVPCDPSTVAAAQWVAEQSMSLFEAC